MNRKTLFLLLSVSVTMLFVAACGAAQPETVTVVETVVLAPSSSVTVRNQESVNDWRCVAAAYIEQR